MTQGLLLMTNGNKDGGVVAPKPLKITVPHFDNSALIKGYARTLIGKCMNPAFQDAKALIIMMPKIWKMEDKVVGTDLGLGRFQFDFDTEEGIEDVLRMQPYHFDYWMISLVRWKPVTDRNYPTELTFWVRVMGVPLQFWAEPTFESIGEALGTVLEVDSDYGRVRVIIDGSKALYFETTVNFNGGQFHEGGEELILLRYEKLFGYCNSCFSLCHDSAKCSLNHKREELVGDPRGYSLTKKRDGAVSYKGAVINGQEDRMGLKENGQEYVGKGKGKLHEEDEASWTRVEGRENKKLGAGRYSLRRGERESRPHHGRFDGARQKLEPRYYSSGNRGIRRERSPRDRYQYQDRSKVRAQETTRSIQSAESGVAKKVASLPEEGLVILAPVKDLGSTQLGEGPENIEDGIDVVNDTLLAQDDGAVGDAMETDGDLDLVGDLDSKGEDVELQNLTDDETERREGETEVTKGDNGKLGVIEAEESTGEVEKNKVLKKKPVKSLPLLGGTTKQRMMQLAAKRTLGKAVSKQTTTEK